MLLQGVLLTLLTGFIWSLIGVVYGKATDKSDSFYSFLFLSALFFALTSWFGAPPSPKAELREIGLAAALLIPAGIASQLGFLALREAMRRGNHAVSWSIAQSAMLCPFAAGMIFFGEPLQALRLLGMLILLGSLIPLSWPPKPSATAASAEENTSAALPAAKHRIFLIFALLAFALLGVQQTLTVVPGAVLPGDSPALSWRLPLLSLPGLGWLGAAIWKRERNFRSIIILAVEYGILTTVGQWVLFQALDRLTPEGAAGMAYPLAVGSCILLFFLYSVFIRKERCGKVGAAGIVAAAAGILILALAAL